MYKLTPRMLQQFKRHLEDFHNLFDGSRCDAWQQEELLVKAIKNDTTAEHHVRWRERGHDDKNDLTVTTLDGKEFPIQIKSGKHNPKKNNITLSGHRLSRFNGNLHDITQYLNDKAPNVISIPYKKIDNDTGRIHKYQVCYIHAKYFELPNSQWEEKQGKKTEAYTYTHTNKHGVSFSLRPTMSWQVWWIVPDRCIEKEKEFTLS